jgi:ABC-type sulfate/molybdate transport systems ATPase subunit
MGVEGFRASVERINRAGVNAKVLLKTESQDPVRVDLTLDRLEELQLQPGDSVYLYPTQSRVFTPDYEI